MEFRLLLYFITVIEMGTFTKAAAALHISQPSLSAAIKQLETNLELTLIDRSTRSFKLTKEGEILYKEAKNLMNYYHYISEEMKRLKLEGPLELKIGLIESAKFWLPKVISDFKKEFPNVHIKLLEIIGPNEIVKSLNEFRIHLAITNEFINDRKIKTIPIYEERLVVLLPPQHPLHKKESITIRDLANEELIISQEGFQTREDTLRVFKEAEIIPSIQFEIERFETACCLVEDNLGITIIPENYVKYSRNSYHIRYIEGANISRTVYIAYDRKRYLPPLVEKFIHLVKSFHAIQR